jgi:hypothetical protein
MEPLINVPTKDSDAKIEGTLNNIGDYVILNNDPHNVHKYVMCKIHCRENVGSPQYLADAIASVITQARDAGFEQGRAFIRDALGIKKGI